MSVDLNTIAVGPGTVKAVKVKAFDECVNLADNPKLLKLTGTVTRSEALVLESVLLLHRREAGSLDPHELQMVASLLTLKGRV